MLTVKKRHSTPLFYFVSLLLLAPSFVFGQCPNVDQLMAHMAPSTLDMPREYDPTIAVVKQTAYKVDKDGIVTEIDGYGIDSTNETGGVISHTLLNTKQIPFHKQLQFFDEDDRVTKTIAYRKVDTLISTYVYDDKGCLSHVIASTETGHQDTVLTTFTEPDGTYLVTKQFVYGIGLGTQVRYKLRDDGNAYQSERYRFDNATRSYQPEHSPSIVKYVYDNQNRLITYTQKLVRSGQVLLRNELSYNTLGDLKQVLVYLASPSLEFDAFSSYYYKYEYDKKGNWISREMYTFEGDVLWMKETREITYR